MLAHVHFGEMDHMNSKELCVLQFLWALPQSLLCQLRQAEESAQGVHVFWISSTYLSIIGNSNLKSPLVIVALPVSPRHFVNFCFIYLETFY